MTDQSTTLRKFILRVEAKPGDHVEFEGPKKITGYYQELGLTCRNEAELVAMVREYIFRDLGSQVIDIDQLRAPDFEGEDRDCIRDITKSDQIGVWWSSGRFFFHEDEEEAPEQEEQEK